MKLCKGLRYVKHGGKYGNAAGIYTQGGRWVFRRNVERAIAGLEVNGATLDWMTPQITERIIGTALYKSWSVEDRRAIGRAISYMIWRDMLSTRLQRANPGVSGTCQWVSADVPLKPTIKRIRIVHLGASQLDHLLQHKKTCAIDPRSIRVKPAMLPPAV